MNAARGSASHPPRAGVRRARCCKNQALQHRRPAAVVRVPRDLLPLAEHRSPQLSFAPRWSRGRPAALHSRLPIRRAIQTPPAPPPLAAACAAHRLRGGRGGCWRGGAVALPRRRRRGPQLDRGPAGAGPAGLAARVSHGAAGGHRRAAADGRGFPARRVLGLHLGRPAVALAEHHPGAGPLAGRGLDLPPSRPRGPLVGAGRVVGLWRRRLALRRGPPAGQWSDKWA